MILLPPQGSPLIRFRTSDRKTSFVQGSGSLHKSEKYSAPVSSLGSIQITLPSCGLYNMRQRLLCPSTINPSQQLTNGPRDLTVRYKHSIKPPLRLPRRAGHRSCIAANNRQRRGHHNACLRWHIDARIRVSILLVERLPRCVDCERGSGRVLQFRPGLHL